MDENLRKISLTWDVPGTEATTGWKICSTSSYSLAQIFPVGHPQKEDANLGSAKF